MKNNLLLILMFVSVVMFNITLFGQLLLKHSLHQAHGRARRE